MRVETFHKTRCKIAPWKKNAIMYRAWLVLQKLHEALYRAAPEIFLLSLRLSIHDNVTRAPKTSNKPYFIFRANVTLARILNF